MPGKRSDNWLKIKARMQQEAVIGGITEGEGWRKHLGALMLGVYDQGRLRYVGNTGTGFSDAQINDLLKMLKPYFTDTCPFEPKPMHPSDGSSPDWFARSRSTSGLAMAK